MPYDSSDARRRTTTHRSQGRAGDSRGLGQGPVTSQGRRPAQARGGSASSYRNSRGYQGVGQGGYNLRQHNIRFNERRGGLLGRILANPRALVFFGGIILVLLLIIFGISSCVRSCSRGSGSESVASSQDSRVAAGLSVELTDQLVSQLDHDALMAQIAAQADKIEDERLVMLALKQPEAVPFVAALLQEGIDYSARPYGADAARGAYPKLYDWDTRWGYVSFSGGALALTGSGPTSLATAYIGLTGATDRTPADIAGAATQAAMVDETYGFTPEFVKAHAAELGLSCEEFSTSGEELSDVMQSGTVVLVQAKPGAFGEEAHWLLVVGENLDGSVNVNDPTSPANSARPWDPATVASAAQSFHALTVKAAEDGAEGTDGTSTTGTSTDTQTQQGDGTTTTSTTV